MDFIIKLPHGPDRVAVLGSADRNVKMVREALGVAITPHEGAMKLSGDRRAVIAARAVFERLAEAAQDGQGLQRSEVLALITRSLDAAQDRESAAEIFGQWPEDSAGALDSDHTAEHPDTLQGNDSDSPHGEFGSIAADAASSSPRSSSADASRQRPDPARAHDPARRPHPARQDPRTAARFGQALDVYVGGQPVQARTENQRAYLDAINQHDVVFGIGPAGTGKTYLAVAAAVHMLKHGRIKKLILARPAVEAGERLGFLPGDLNAKVNPYLRPLFDALNDMMDFNTMKRFMVSDIVEVVPLAYMRGRTLNRACIILDEAQNTTRGQMKMFLTRMGHGSKVIVTGDATQIDLPDPSESGLIHSARILSRVPGIGFISLTEQDIVRHPMVARIVEAYGRYEPKRDEGANRRVVDAAAGVPGTPGLGGSPEELAELGEARMWASRGGRMPMNMAPITAPSTPSPATPAAPSSPAPPAPPAVPNAPITQPTSSIDASATPLAPARPA